MPKIFKDKNNNVLYTGYETNEIVANPTLAGTESELTGIQIGDTKYKAPEGFSGDYNDLTNKPTIPTVNNPTITFTQGGVNKGSFTLNQSNNKTIALDAGGGEGGGGESVSYNADEGIEIKDKDYSIGIFEPKVWNGLTEFYGSSVWTDGENIYYSAGSDQYVLDKATSTWSPKTWNGLSEFVGVNVWTFNGKFYYSGSTLSEQYVLDKNTSTWSRIDWGLLGYSSIKIAINGVDIWKKGYDTYYSDYNNTYIIRTEGLCEKVYWSGNNIPSYGRYIWGSPIGWVYSNGSNQLVLQSNSWVKMPWINTNPFMNISIFQGDKIWTDGEKTYLTNGLTYMLCNNISWEKKEWRGVTDLDNFNGHNIWTDGENIYYSEGTQHYKLISSYLPNAIELKNGDTPNFTQSTTTSFDKKWEFGPWFKTQEDIYYFAAPGRDTIWTDGENIYYSYYYGGDSEQYVLDKVTSTWSKKTWNGLTAFSGKYIWTDGEDVYYSDWSDKGGEHYILDKATSTWSPKTWNGLSNFYGYDIWTDGENIYCSYGEHYVLDKATSTWSQKTWTGLPEFDADDIWTDGENIYVSLEDVQYVLDKATSTWSPKTWNGLTNFSRDDIWTDGENIYYSRSSDQYVLDKATSTWLPKRWLGQSPAYAYDVWTDGKDVYVEGSGSIESGVMYALKLTSSKPSINTKPVLTSASSSSSAGGKTNVQDIAFSGEVLTKEFLGVTDAEATTIPVNYENLRKILAKEGYDLIDAPVGEGTVLSQTGDIFKLTICPSVYNAVFGKRGEGLIEIYTEEVDGDYNLQIKTACPNYSLGHIDNYTIESGETENLGDILTKVGAAVEATPEDFNEFPFFTLDTSSVQSSEKLYYHYVFSNLIILHRDAIDDYEYIRIKDVDTFIKLVFKSSGGGSSE